MTVSGPRGTTSAGPQGDSVVLLGLAHAVAAVSSMVNAEARPTAIAWLFRCAAVPITSPLPTISITGDNTQPSGSHSDSEVDEVLELAWRTLPDEVRIELGSVFTPRQVARQLLLEMQFPGEAVEDHLVDPACGGGIFLVEAARMRASALAGRPALDIANTILNTTHGVDIHPIACRLASLFLGLEVAHVLVEAPAHHFEQLRPPSILHFDATATTAPDVIVSHTGGVAPRWVVGNPPYLEAKRMPVAQRTRLRTRFAGRLKGAFDLYVCFLHLGLDLVGQEGRLGFVLPNKFQVARYAERIRTQLVSERRLARVVDLSELDVFRRIGVYPILLVVAPSSNGFLSVYRHQRLEDLGHRQLDGTVLDYDLLRAVAEPPVFFTLPSGPFVPLLQRVLAQFPRLEEQVEVRSTCSFHKKGLREQYVTASTDAADGLPYLGGKSFVRRNEIRPFTIRWSGHRIRYDVQSLSAVGNPLPPLEIFHTPKVIYCQHARGMVAALDAEGTYVTKDVYPVALPRDRSHTTAAALTAVLNSRLFSTVYALLFRGIQVGGNYLHLLPVYLRRMPLPVLAPEAAALAARTLAITQNPTRAQFELLDEAVANLYEMEDAERLWVRTYADRWLGFDTPINERR